ncbi:UNVERIFIED_CONTAM: hypothetical protein K2H54_045705 [Gekko kuhli]
MACSFHLLHLAKLKVPQNQITSDYHKPKGIQLPYMHTCMPNPYLLSATAAESSSEQTPPPTGLQPQQLAKHSIAQAHRHTLGPRATNKNSGDGRGAVKTPDAFTGYSLKSNIGAGCYGHRNLAKRGEGSC